MTTTDAPGTESGRPLVPTRLGADDWVRAAFEIMVDEGIGGVKIQRLCDRLGVTKGSFYHHFDDVDAFLRTVADAWSEHGAQQGPTPDHDGDPEAAMLHAMAFFSDRRARALTKAMRDWAQHDERAREAIVASDRAVFSAVSGVFRRLGFDAGEAEVRAKILYYAGVGFAHVGPLGSSASARTHLLDTWQILTRR